MAKASKLVEVFAKAEYARDMVTQAQDSIHHPGGLWYHAIGLFNAYYAIIEELLNRTKNGNDVALTQAVDAWWVANKPKANSFFQRERNIATHQGEIEVEYFTEWEPDHVNDTSHPIRSAKVSIKGSTSVQDLSGLEFLNLCRPAMEFLYDGILAIDVDYKARGGTLNALPEPDDLSDIFKDFEL